MKTKMVRPKTGMSKQKPSITASGKYILRLYIAGQTRIAVTALNNLKSLCEEQLKEKYNIKVIDILKNPQVGCDNQILAIPTLMRKSPLPVRWIIGDLSNTKKVLVGLDLIGNN